MARFSAEAEYGAMTHGVCELLYIKNLMEKLRITSDNLVSLFCDNKAAINIAHNLVEPDKTKHIEIYKYFIKKKINDDGTICIPFVNFEIK